MSGSSTVAGPLLPVAGGPAPLQGRALNVFFHDWLVGLTGIDPTLMRPEWQPEPANRPDAGVCWCSFHVGVRPSDDFPYVGHDGAADDGLGRDQLQRQETISLLTRWYDLGINGLADQYCALLRDGTVISQNREVLIENGFNFVYCTEPTPAPALLKERWDYRVDMTLIMRRVVVRDYAVRNLVQAAGTIKAQQPGAPSLFTRLFQTFFPNEDS